MLSCWAVSCLVHRRYDRYDMSFWKQFLPINTGRSNKHWKFHVWTDSMKLFDTIYSDLTRQKQNERKVWRFMPLCWSQSIRINVDKSSPVFVAVALNSWNSARSDGDTIVRGDLAFNQGCWVCRCSKTLKLDLVRCFFCMKLCQSSSHSSLLTLFT